MGGEVRYTSDRNVRSIGKGGKPTDIDSLSLALKIKGFARGIKCSASEYVTGNQTGVYILDRHFGAMEAGARGQALKRLTRKFAWAKLQIGAPDHRIGNPLDVHVPGNVSLCIF